MPQPHRFGLLVGNVVMFIHPYPALVFSSRLELWLIPILVSKIVHNDYDDEEAAAWAHAEMSASNYLQRETKHTHALDSGIDKELDERWISNIDFKVRQLGPTMLGNQVHWQATYYPR